MTSITISSPKPWTVSSLPEAPDHGLGAYDRGNPGPTLVVVAGLHGNEPSGIVAYRRVLDSLQAAEPGFRGRLVGLAGNLEALQIGQRFLDEDLNRIWQHDRVRMIQQNDDRWQTREAREQRELLAQLETEISQAGGPVHFLDLHTSSAQGKPFVCIGDTLRNRRFATGFHVPVILGLEEQVDGALLEYVNNKGHITVGVEAGQHHDERSIDLHEAFLRLALVNAGCIDDGSLPDQDQMRARLEEASRGLPPVLEVRYRHPVAAVDEFRMNPGYENFDPVKRDEVIAADARGGVHAPETGRVLLPLYQGQGDDGFFLVREFARFWLAVSALLRHLRLGAIVPWLPGVHTHPDHADTLIVDRHVARWFTVEIFHLLGYRKERSKGHQLLFSRRVETL
jgi:succinylglutamate desuccinylase